MDALEECGFPNWRGYPVLDGLPRHLLQLVMSNRLARKEREFARTRQDILMAARAVFRRKSVVVATARDIAQEAGFTVGALYRYFENKEEIINAAVDEIAERSLIAWSIERAEGELFSAYFKRAVMAQLEIFTEDLALFDTCAQVRNDEKYRPVGVSASISENWLNAIKRLLKQGRKEGAIRKGNLDIMSFHVRGALRAAISMGSELMISNLEDVADELVDFVLVGLGEPPEVQRNSK